MSTKITKEEVGDLSPGLSSTLVEWKIRELFSLLPKMDYEIKSPFFHFLDASWHLEMNINSQSGGYIGLSLVRKQSETENHRIRYTLRMQTKDGTELNRICQEGDFSKCIPSWSYPMFVVKSKLVRGETEFNPEGLIIISCDLCAQELETGKPVSLIESHKNVDKLVENFKELFLSEKVNNVILSMKDCKFICHRGVLAAQSPVFADMLMQNDLKMTTKVIEIEDCEPEAFDKFLYYLHRGCIMDCTEDIALGLYQIADKYKVPKAKATCVYFLTINLCVKNFCDVVDLALRHSDSELLQRAVTFFAKNTNSILVTLNWQNFLKKNPIAANELHLKCLDEDNTLDTNEDKTLFNMRGVNKLGEDFKELFLSEEGSDITLSVRDRTFMCHRAVLSARSSVFAAMLKQDMLENTTGTVEIDDCEPEAFQEFLTYLYSGNEEDFTKENIFGLYRVADKYDAPEVKARCIHLLTIDLCVENFCDVVDLAFQYNESALLQTAVNFFVKNTKDILVTANWRNFIEKNSIGETQYYMQDFRIRIIPD